MTVNNDEPINQCQIHFLPDCPDCTEGEVGYYASIQRGQRYGLLLGPELTRAAAEARVDEARRLAREVDPDTAFDAFGVTRVQADTLPEGRLNARSVRPSSP